MLILSMIIGDSHYYPIQYEFKFIPKSYGCKSISFITCIQYPDLVSKFDIPNHTLDQIHHQ